MKTLVVEDEFINRSYMIQLLAQYGSCDSAVNGREALEAVKLALEENDPYQLICLDIMMPEIDGQEALRQIREFEGNMGIHGLDGARIIMTTCLGDHQNILKAFSDGQCEAYMVKPITPEKLLSQLRELCLLDQN